MDERELYKRFACSSMFMYCRKLGMSEGSCARRIDSARAIRKFPSLLPLIERGELHLTALSIVCSILTPENVDSVIASVAGKSKREVEEIKVRLAPKPDVSDMIRKLPSMPTAATIALAPPPVAVTEPAMAPRESSRPSFSLLAPPPVAAMAPAIRISRPEAPVVPIREDGYKVQFQTDKARVDQIERIKAMMRHRNPKGDLATIYGEAMDLLEAKLEKEILAVTSRPQKVQRPCAPGRVSAATRREVFERDGRQCTFVDADGNRCPERGCLELDHIEPAAWKGPAEASNLRVRCRAHNQMHAKDTFGADYVERRIEKAKKERAAKRAARHSAGGGSSGRAPSSRSRAS